MGDKLGKIAAFIAKGKFTQVTVKTHGAELKSARHYITAAVSAGIVEGPEVNLVNSAAIAKEKGHEVNLESLKHLFLCHVVKSFPCCVLLILDEGKKMEYRGKN